MPNLESFSHESLEDAQSIARYLDALKEGLQKGTLSLENESGELQLAPHGLLGCEIRARKKGGKVKLRLQITWQQEPREGSADGFKIKTR